MSVPEIPERVMHLIRLVLSVGWLALIGALFYQGENIIDPEICLQNTVQCLIAWLHTNGLTIFWVIVVPAAIFMLLIWGDEAWRRICPLYMLSQIPRALGLPALLKIDNNPWLIRHHLYVQFALLFLGLSVRLLLVNSDHRALGIFLIFTIISAIAFVWLYGGRAWCHYACPFGPVQAILTGPRGLLGSEPLKASPDTVPNSGCRTFDKTVEKDRFDCMGCKAPCRDQDTERTYWEDLSWIDPQQRDN